jgi:hypothetical protein
MNESDELSRLLGAWARRHRLTEAQALAVRAHVRSVANDAAPALDAEWLWSLLRPVTALIDRLELMEPVMPDTSRTQWTTYLQLA